MANTNIRIACVLLLFLILHHQDLYVQGKRHLKDRLNRWSKDGENFSNAVPHGDRGRMHDDDDAHEGRKGRVEFEEKDFRPTSPGHSPGVGHSINN
ncbi:hypothetical protein LR48_Vigan06g034600 [Vigna angularis]|uniref:Uncharacterized protein n=2 Tax=Phaseolus angularis TaxID=3914 RepID=A0A0L9UQ83_PHAAN|nr:hypothetical protein LR48_Vigan06g034600 [Vigna angularis]BAU00196.1 hypothetical protein VIGAN_10176700 [Vigna angularis var. angularis]